MRSLPRIAAALVTPFGDDGNIRHDLLRTHSRALLAQGVEGLALFGSTGEALSLSVAERMHALNDLVESGVDPLRMIVGVSASALPEAIELTRHAVAQGAHIVLAHPPVFFKDLTRGGVLAWYERLIDSVANDELKLILYHWPRLTGVAIDEDLVAALRDKYPRIVVGYKDSSGDFARAVALGNRFSNFAIYLGGASKLAPFFDAGGHGAICASANVLGAELAMLTRLQGADRNAQHARIERLEAVLDPFGFVQGPKAVLATRYGDMDWNRVRPPLEALAQDRAERLVQALSAEIRQHAVFKHPS